MSLKLVTAEQMREIDRVTIQERGVPGLELMERAGRAVADVILEDYDTQQVGIVTGKGNNAGDGLVVARLLAEKGVAVKIVMLAEPQNLSDAARKNYERLPKCIEILDRHSVPKLEDAFADCDVVIDAILGTGVTGPVRGVFGEAVTMLNALNGPIMSIDVPSGLNSDDGSAEGACVIAETTVTMGLAKLGMVIGQGPMFCGQLEIADLGFPEDLVASDSITTHLLELPDVSAALPERRFDGHKGTFGSLLVIAGSVGMSGAASLTTESALRSGCGLVYCAAPARVIERIASRIVCAVKVPVRGDDGERLEHESWEELEPWLGRADAVALGPGLGTATSTARLVDELVCQDVPMVIDADALNCLGEKTHYLTNRGAPAVVTPHPGEMGRLMSMSAADVQKDRIGVARALAQDSGVVVALKGAQTVVAAPDGRIFINPSGNNGMAKGGSGDVLTGLIGGFLAQGVPALEAGCAGVFVHGLAGDMTMEEIGPRGMTPEDMLQRLPEALNLFP